MSALENMDRRIWYVLMVLSLFIPLIRPLGLPLSTSPEVRAFYETVEALPEGSVVIVSPSYTPGTEAELWPQHVALVQHLMRKGVKIVHVALEVNAVMYAEHAMDLFKDEYGYVYGEDIVNMPYKAGLDVAIASMGRDFTALYSEDYKGAPLAQMPIMKDIKSITDIALVVDFMPGNTLVDFIKQIEGPYKVPVTGGVTGVCIPTLMPFVASGQCRGLLGGMRGAAEYEMLIGAPGKAVGGMDAQSLSHLLVIVSIIIGNTGQVLSRYRKGGAV